MGGRGLRLKYLSETILDDFGERVPPLAAVASPGLIRRMIHRLCSS